MPGIDLVNSCTLSHLRLIRVQRRDMNNVSQWIGIVAVCLLLAERALWSGEIVK